MAPVDTAGGVVFFQTKGSYTGAKESREPIGTDISH